MGGSTSHKRRSPRRGGKSAGSGSRAKPSAAIPVPRTLTFDDQAITAGRGYDLLSKYGWKAGTSLGSSPAKFHTIAPIPIVVRPPRMGIGSSPASLPSPTAISKQVAERVFDPLRPRCRFDHTHIVPSLKALQKHEASCPSNPTRHHRHHDDDHLSSNSDDDDFDDYSDLSDSESESESHNLRIPLTA